MTQLAFIFGLVTIFDYAYAAQLNCFGQTCDSTNHYCQIQLQSHTGYCYTHHGHGHHEDHQKCIGAHHPGDHCFCHDQACINSIAASFPQAATTSAPTAAPTTIGGNVAPVIELFTCFGKSCSTPQVCSVTFVNDIAVSGSCEDHKTGRPNCIQPKPPSNGDCECDSRLCMGIIDTLTTQASLSVTTAGTNSGTTAAPETTTAFTGTTPIPTCADQEDANFKCKDYNDLYGMCTALTTTLQNIAKTRCPKFCNICTGNGTAPTQSSVTGTTTRPPCVDHDARCTQNNFKQVLCSSAAPAETKKYAIATCPLTCNYCNEYFASLTDPVACNQCGDLLNSIPCSRQEIYQNATSNLKCSQDKPFCMTDVIQDATGNKDVYKRCVDDSTCRTKWISESADLDYCSQFDVVKNPAPFECHFCCHGDYCNIGMVPPKSSWVAKPAGK